MSKAPERDELESLLPYANETQRRHIESVIKHGSTRKASVAVGRSRNAIDEAIRRAKMSKELAVVRHVNCVSRPPNSYRRLARTAVLDY